MIFTVFKECKLGIIMNVRDHAVRWPKRSLFTCVGTQSPSSLDDNNDLSSSSLGSSTESLGFKGRLGFLGKSLARKPSDRNLLHLAVHTSSASLWVFTISFHCSSRAAFAVFRSTCYTSLFQLCSFLSPSSPFGSFTK